MPTSPSFSLHGTAYPVTSVNPSLRTLDPFVYNALDFAEHIAEKFLGDVFYQSYQAVKTSLESLGLEFKDFPGNADGYIIGQAIPYNPIPYLRDQGFAFPLLAIYRGEVEVLDKTIHLANKRSKITLDWILPPLQPQQAAHLLPFRNGLFDVFKNRFLQSSDPDFAGQAPDGYRFTEYAHLNLVGGNADLWLQFQSDNAAQKLFYPMVTITMQVDEMDLGTGFDTLEGFDFSLDKATDGYADFAALDLTVDLSGEAF